MALNVANESEKHSEDSCVVLTRQTYLTSGVNNCATYIHCAPAVPCLAASPETESQHHQLRYFT